MEEKEIKIIDTQYLKEQSIFGIRYTKIIIYLPVGENFLEKIYYPIDELEYNKNKK